MLDTITTSRVESFTAAAGISPEYFLSKIANEWLDEKGDYTIRRINKLRKTRTTRRPKQSSQLVEKVPSARSTLHLHRLSVTNQPSVP